jgi:glycosyltransferase involved in cell wall biosynthesis
MNGALSEKAAKTSARTRIRVISNMEGLGHMAVPGWDVEVTLWQDHRRIGALLQFFIKSFRSDYVLLNAVPRTLLLMAALMSLAPFNRCKLVALDILLSRPTNGIERFKTWIRSLLLRRVHRILLYYRDTSQIRKYFRLPPERFEYIPFKINRYDLVSAAKPVDGDYVFCGGKTRRDFDTLAKAVAVLDVPVKIVTTPNEDIARHGSHLEESHLPPQIEVTRLDGSAKPFIDLMAASRLVVLPLKPDITGTGIGVYIMAMALGKPVIISEGPGTVGVLDADLAVIVPPEDPDALQAAIRSVYLDRALRARLSENGRRYALALGDEERLLKSIWEWLIADFESRRRA